MECGSVEERLSEYVERSLPHEEMLQVAEHLQACPSCLGLMEEMRSVLVTCRSFPSYDVEPALIDRILLRTSGRPRTLSLRERFRAYFLRPVLTPRFAAGAALAVLFLALLANQMAPRLPVLASALSPREVFRRMDRGVQKIYSEGLKLYDTKNEYQAQFTFYKNIMLNKLGFMIEQLDAPVEGKQKPDEEKQPEKGPKKKSSVSLFPA